MMGLTPGQQFRHYCWGMFYGFGLDMGLEHEESKEFADEACSAIIRRFMEEKGRRFRTEMYRIVRTVKRCECSEGGKAAEMLGKVRASFKGIEGYTEFHLGKCRGCGDLTTIPVGNKAMDIALEAGVTLEDMAHMVGRVEL